MESMSLDEKKAASSEVSVSGSSLQVMAGVVAVTPLSVLKLGLAPSPSVASSP